MSFLMGLIYPYRVWVASGAVMESSMTKAENADTGGAAKHSGSCGAGHDHSGHGPHDHHASKPKAAVPEGTSYTCPMHPQIRQIGPGNCPICGMALEPEVASLDA